MLAQYLLMALWASVIAAIPIGWFLLGIKTYGTLDYDGAQRTTAAFMGDPTHADEPVVH